MLELRIRFLNGILAPGNKLCSAANDVPHGDQWTPITGTTELGWIIKCKLMRRLLTFSLKGA